MSRLSERVAIVTGASKGIRQGRAMTATNIGIQRPSTALRRSDGLSAIASLRQHWPEYLMQVGELGFYLSVACVAPTLLQHPAPIVQQSTSSSVGRMAPLPVVL